MGLPADRDTQEQLLIDIYSIVTFISLSCIFAEQAQYLVTKAKVDLNMCKYLMFYLLSFASNLNIGWTTS